MKNSRKKCTRYLLWVLVSLVYWDGSFPLLAQESKNDRELMVSAAMSLKDVMIKLGDGFRKKNKEIKVLFNFAASGQLRMQIENGAPVDIFVPASSSDMDLLIKKSLVLEGTKRVLSGNELVLIVSQKSNLRIQSVQDLLKSSVKKVACGNPDIVPAGKYAKETMNYFGSYGDLKAKVVLGENVRQVLDYVSRNEVDAGFVFATDAKTDPKVKIVMPIPTEAHAEISYPIAVMKDSRQQQAAKSFIEYAVSVEAQTLLMQYGFKNLRK